MNTHEPMNENEIEIPLFLEEGSDSPIYSTLDAAGADLKAYLSDAVTISPGGRALISTGIKLCIPPGYEAEVRPRSGLALKYGVTVLNAPGTIDSDYRGVVGVILINHGEEPFVVEPGMRIAQLVVAPVVRAKFLESASLATTARGSGGFGHTGL